MVCTVADKAVFEAFQSSTIQIAVEQDVEMCVAEPHIVDAVETRTISAPAATVPMADFIKNEAERHSFKNAKIAFLYNRSGDAVHDHKNKTRDESLPVRIGLNRSAPPMTNISNVK